MRTAEYKCDEAKRQRSHFINLSKRTEEGSKLYEDLLDKADSVDLTTCEDVKNFRVSYLPFNFLCLENNRLQLIDLVL